MDQFHQNFYLVKIVKRVIYEDFDFTLIEFLEINKLFRIIIMIILGGLRMFKRVPMRIFWVVKFKLCCTCELLATFVAILADLDGNKKTTDVFSIWSSTRKMRSTTFVSHLKVFWNQIFSKKLIKLAYQSLKLN